MGVELVKKHVSIAIKRCNGLVVRHPLLVFTLFVLFWIYRFFPFLFSLLVLASPVIATSLVLLGTLLFYGHANVAKVDKEGKKAHNRNLKIVDQSYFVNKKLNQDKKSEVAANSEMKISSNGSQRNSIDGNVVLDDKGWETGSDLVGSSSPRSSMGDMFPMLDELDPLLESEVRQQRIDYGSDRSIESAEVINETDDYDDDDDEHDLEVKDDDDDEEEEDDIVITWTEDDQRNVKNLGTSELERNQRLDNLIARQQALKNMRMKAENNMVNVSPNLALNATHILTARMNPFDHSYDPNQNFLGSAPVTMPRRNPFDHPYDPSGQKLPDQVGPTFQSNYPFNCLHESFDVGPSTLGPYFVPERIASDGITFYSLQYLVLES